MNIFTALWMTVMTFAFNERGTTTPVVTANTNGSAAVSECKPTKDEIRIFSICASQLKQVVRVHYEAIGG